MLPMEYEAVRLFGDGYIVSRKRGKAAPYPLGRANGNPLGCRRGGGGRRTTGVGEKGGVLWVHGFHGKSRHPLEYEGVTVFTGGYAAVKEENGDLLIAAEGFVCPLCLTMPPPFSEGIAVVNTAGRFHLLFDAYEGGNDAPAYGVMGGGRPSRRITREWIPADPASR